MVGDIHQVADVPVPAVASLLADAYGLSGDLTPIATSKDNTYRLDGPSGRHLLKVSAPEESPVEVDLQVAAMRHLEHTAPGLPVQRVLPAGNGSLHVPLPSSPQRSLRVLTWTHGRQLADVPWDVELLRQVGRIHGELVRALSDFAHPAQDRYVEWDLQHLSRIHDVLSLVDDASRRAFAEEVLDAFAARVEPLLGRLPRQVVHADLSPYNVVIGEEGTVAGIIDFGDLVRTPVLFDVTIPMSNLLDAALDDPWRCADAHLAGFQQVHRLGDRELALLPVTAPARVVFRCLMKARLAAADPARREYLDSHGARDWDNAMAAWRGPKRS
jgi:Ser/Thr protein kinase RdoA (MazF antagonist)